VTHLADLRLDLPVLAKFVEVLDDESGRQPAVDFDAMIAACFSALNDGGANVCSLNLDIPAKQQREMFTHHHCEAIGFLTA